MSNKPQQMMLMAKIVSINDATIRRGSGTPGEQYAGISIDSSGDIIAYGDGVPFWTVNYGRWLLSGTNQDYEVRYVLLTGNATDNNYTLNVWRRTNITPQPQVYNTPSGADATVRVDLRQFGGDGTIIDSAVYTLKGTFLPL